MGSETITQTELSCRPDPIRADEAKVPELREDLQLLPSSRLDDGSPSWTIVDPLRLQYYRIGWQEFEILSRWHTRKTADIATLVNQQTTLHISTAQVEEVALFLKNHNLVKTVLSEPLFKQYQALTSKNFLSSLIKNYLFIKLPLFHPDRFLAATMPMVRLFFSPLFWVGVLLMGLLASFLTLRQLDSFQQTFIHFFSLEGLIYYAAALTFTKVVHEFGHAYTAKKYGLHIPTMGVACILLWPILYTDTTDAWRLREKKQRLQIGYAGMLMEIGVGIAALFLWSFLPEGPAKSAVFFLATTTWVVTLSVNLNPFMRFDGYYLFSDLLDVPNLQKQAFGLGKWRLRKLLFGFKDPCPVNLPSTKKLVLQIYAYSTWIYRFFLFLGIAVLVYQFTFKLLGIFLMAFEITLFITLPIARELKACWQRRASVGFNWRLVTTFFIVCGLTLAGIYPWPTIIHVPATYETANYAAIYPPHDGQLIDTNAVNNGVTQKNELLFSLHSPALTFQVEQAQREVDLLKLQLKKVASSSSSEEQLQIVQKKLTEKLTALKGFQDQIAQLRVVAPWRGRVIMATPLTPGRWVNKNEPLATLVDESAARVEGYVHENQFHHIHRGDSGLFYDETTDINPFQVTVQTIDHVGTKYLPKPYLASEFGGNIPVELSKAGRLATHSGYYKITMQPTNQKPSFHVVRGSVRFEGKPQNFFQRIWPQIAAVFIRESGF